MANAVYTICLRCYNIQVRTDIITSFGNKPFIRLDRKVMCPKCHALTENIATKDIKKFKVLLNQTDNQLAKKLREHII